MADIASSAAASAARLQLDTVGIGVGVGAGFLSNITEEESVVEITCVPEVPAKSLKSIVKATIPSVSPEARSKAAVQSVPHRICVGIFLLELVPSPSWPYKELEPQAQRVSSDFRPTVCSLPAAMADQ